MRPYGGYYYNLGRETFLVPVRWEQYADGWWPIVAPHAGKIEFEQAAPNLPSHPWPSQSACDDFDSSTLGLYWVFLRTPHESWHSLSEHPGYLRLHLRPEKLSELVNPSFIGRRQQHIHFAAHAAMEFTPQGENECAGMALVQNNQFNLQFVVQLQAGRMVVRLLKREQGQETLLAEKLVLAEKPITATRVYFKIEAHGQEYGFYIATASQHWESVAEHVDGRILSTPVAGGFVGTMIGLYASSQGEASRNVADFDWFEYREIE
jgi:xylan 1,4-beta-xylosidase